MISRDPNHLLFIHPRNQASDTPVIDGITRIIEEAYATSTKGPAYRGWHTCTGCGAASDNVDHYITRHGRRYTTNSLAVHYLKFHRDEVPAEEIVKVAALTPAAPEDRRL